MDHDRPLTSPGGTQRSPQSPPTDRVIAIVEALAREPRALSVADLVARLDLNRSTATAILASLERAGWTHRNQDRTYRLGLGLLGLAEAVKGTAPLVSSAAREVDRLARRVGCGASLAYIGVDQLIFAHVARGDGTVPAGISTGVRLPVRAPTGASVVAFRGPEQQQHWLATGNQTERSTLENLLVQIRQTGVAVFGPGRAEPEVLELLDDAVQLLAENPGRRSLQLQVFKLLSQVGGKAYTASELIADQPLPVSYITTPLCSGSGTPEFELQIGPLRDAISRDERQEFIRELASTVAKLNEATAG
ncbi:helix-turn-helix domain-containing protein [Rhodococcus sp. BH2-1]|nr:helix-turn-helix domain-containing protein [Rhodococcus sp. BH2-1]